MAMKKTLLSKLFFVALASIILSSCKSLPIGNNDKEVVLTFWGLWESANVNNLIINDYKKDHPNVTITYHMKNPQKYRESLQSQIASGKGPDIFVFHNTWTAMLASELSELPTSIVSQKDIKENYFPVIFEDLRNTGKKFIGLPTGIDGLGLYWNEDIFRAAGIASPPTTWQELSQTAAKLTVKGPDGNIRTAGIAIGTASNVDHYSDILGIMILQNNGDIKNPTDQRSSDTLEYYTRFAKGDNRVWDESQPSSTIAFIGGNLAMYFGPSWRAAEIKEANPTLNFKIAPIPQLDENKTTWASYWALGVSSKSANQEEAWKFIKYLQEDQTLIKFYDEARKSPGRIFGEIYPKLSLAKTLSSDAFVGSYVTDAPYMKSFPMASRTFDEGINDQIIKAYEDAINKNLSGRSAADSLKTTATNVTNILKKYNFQ
ncbi:MAG: Extracellular solute-binding protein family 1 [Candidatus Curtissbacteria bacterium GW2011_GWA1_40_9]|uniref:Extracellular solute-binding protein family 1 n=1 Tax=Candidatus Curtissbacteria bacterium GW2011_GWA1_40_9 TaxID=1618408 RepID=A0A0G0TTR1_9BACT|nr:MAG: Extracellular solute-binding protein family 1 [Candidatus Curtissbacteria bacterium GW2011_GWA1_40_9]